MILHHYGDTYVAGELCERGTIHDSGVIDVQIDLATGEVTSVWFRCMELPYRVCTVRGGKSSSPDIILTAVEYLDAE